MRRVLRIRNRLPWLPPEFPREPTGGENNVWIKTENLRDGADDAYPRFKYIKHIPQAREASPPASRRCTVGNAVLEQGGRIKRRRPQVEKFRLEEYPLGAQILHRFSDRNERVKMPTRPPA